MSDDKPILNQIADAGTLATPPPPPSELAMALFDAFQMVVESAHDHHWKILGIKHEQIGYEHPRQPPSKLTAILLRCFDCGDIQTTNLHGHWTLEEILRDREIEYER